MLASVPRLEHNFSPVLIPLPFPEQLCPQHCYLQDLSYHLENYEMIAISHYTKDSYQPKPCQESRNIDRFKLSDIKSQIAYKV